MKAGSKKHMVIEGESEYDFERMIDLIRERKGDLAKLNINHPLLNPSERKEDRYGSMLEISEVRGAGKDTDMISDALIKYNSDLREAIREEIEMRLGRLDLLSMVRKYL